MSPPKPLQAAIDMRMIPHINTHPAKNWREELVSPPKATLADEDDETYFGSREPLEEPDSREETGDSSKAERRG